jgi:hypothetical protein
MIQLRNVPDGLHRSLKARAAMAGMSLSDYLLAEIKEIAERPTLAELQQVCISVSQFRLSSIPLAWCEKSESYGDRPGCVRRN